MLMPKAELEHWMREFYFDCPFDLGSSGVQSYSFAQLREMVGITHQDMDAVVLDDSLTLGAVGLRKAISCRWGNGDYESVMVTSGSNEILYYIMETLLDQGDEVVVLEPIYHALCTVAEEKGCNLLRWKMRPEFGFVPDLEELKELLSDKTKMVCVNLPHNPTGATIDRASFDELIKLVSKTKAYLVWDAAFEDMVEGDPLPNPFYLYEKAISVGTLSKGYGLPGLRIGWCFAPKEVLEGCVRMRDYTTLFVSPLLEVIAEKVIWNSDKLLRPRMAVSKNNLKLLEKWVSEHKQFVDWVRPSGGVTCVVKIKGVDNTETFCRTLAKEHGVMVVPGMCFGMPRYIRLGFGFPTSEFVKGLEALTESLFSEIVEFMVE